MVETHGALQGTGLPVPPRAVEASLNPTESSHVHSLPYMLFTMNVSGKEPHQDWQDISACIRQNPLRWELDCLYSPS